MPRPSCFLRRRCVTAGLSMVRRVEAARAMPSPAIFYGQIGLDACPGGRAAFRDQKCQRTGLDGLSAQHRPRLPTVGEAEQAKLPASAKRLRNIR